MIYILEHSYPKTARSRCSTAYRCSTFQPAVLQHFARVKWVRPHIKNQRGLCILQKPLDGTVQILIRSLSEARQSSMQCWHR